MGANLNLELLTGTPFGRAVGAHSLARLLNGSVVQILPSGAVLFEEGALPEAAHVVLSGRVGLTAAGGTENETVIEVFGPGTLLLLPALVLGLPYLASGVLFAESRIMTVRADVFRAELDADARFARAVVDVLARHWRLLIEQIKDLKLRDASERLADWILREADGQGAVVVSLMEPKRLVAKRLGMSPESFSRALSALGNAGAIRVKGREVVVVDREKLRVAAKVSLERLTT